MNVSQMNETIASVSKALGPLAEKIGQGTEHVYALAVKDCYLSGVLEAGWSVLFLVVAIIFFIMRRRQKIRMMKRPVFSLGLSFFLLWLV